MAMVVKVRFKRASKLYDFDANDLDLHCGTRVVTETARGVELGECMSGVYGYDDELLAAPLKPIIRIATEQDLITQKENEQAEKDAFDIAIEKIAEHELEMKLVDVEYAFDRSKIIFYFTANGRVDFRMLVKNLAADPWLTIIRCLSLIAENHLPELFCNLTILFPPCTNRVHVMSRSGTYREIWIICRMCKRFLHRLRHTLYLERKDPEIRHYLRHSSRNHSEILTASKHSCRVEKCRKFLHGLFLPELVVATIEEVIVKAVICRLTICIKIHIACS